MNDDEAAYGCRGPLIIHNQNQYVVNHRINHDPMNLSYFEEKRKG